HDAAVHHLGHGAVRQLELPLPVSGGPVREAAGLRPDRVGAPSSTPLNRGPAMLGRGPRKPPVTHRYSPIPTLDRWACWTSCSHRPVPAVAASAILSARSACPGFGRHPRP